MGVILVTQANGVTFLPELDSLIEATFKDKNDGYWTLVTVFGDMKISLVNQMHAWKQL